MTVAMAPTRLPATSSHTASTTGTSNGNGNGNTARRVLHVTDCYLPRRGGIELHVRDLATNQRAAGTDARVVTPLTTPGSAGDADWVTRINVDGPLTLPGIGGEHELLELIERFRPDAVHAHLSVFSPFTSATVRIAAGLGIPTVVTVHSMWHHPILSTVVCSAFQLRHLPVMWTAVSAAAAEQVAKVLGPNATVSVIPNAVDLSAWMPLSGESPHIEPIRIVSVMRLARRKRPLPFVRMLAEVRANVPAEIDLRATIIGDGPKRNELRRYLARNSMDNWVETPGLLERSEIRAEFARSSFYVAPAWLESFGIAALEARTAGLPVVASSRSGVGEFITDGIDGSLVADDQAMTDAMIRLVTDAHHLKTLTNHARTHEPNFGWTAGVRNSLIAYDQAAWALDAKPQSLRPLLRRPTRSFATVGS